MKHLHGFSVTGMRGPSAYSRTHVPQVLDVSQLLRLGIELTFENLQKKVRPLPPTWTHGEYHGSTALNAEPWMRDESSWTWKLGTGRVKIKEHNEVSNFFSEL